MTYNPNIPNPTDFLSDSQGQIKNNFNSANTVYGTNHFAFNDASANAGKHKYLVMPLNTGIPGTAVGDINLFNTNFAVGAPSVLCFTRDGQGPNFTRITGIIDPLSSANPGYTILMGGMLLQWGIANVTSSTTVTMPQAFTSNGVAANGYNVQVTPISPAAVAGTRDYVVNTLSSQTFKITWVGYTGTVQFYYMAIGPKT
jgi:hypothetical protein